MTRQEFNAECQKLTIDPAVALENENVCKALRALEDDEVRRLLREEF